jgi:HlyD family secretion protein
MFVVGVGIATVAAISVFFAAPSSSRLSVEGDRLSTARVTRGRFLEYVPVIGRVQSSKTVYIDSVHGGLVEEIVAEEGDFVNKGDLILRLSNPVLQQNTIQSESRLIENLDDLRNSQALLSQAVANSKTDLLDIDYQIGQLERERVRYEDLETKGSLALTRKEIEELTARIDYQKQRRIILEDRIEQDNALRKAQLASIEDSLERTTYNLTIVRQTLDYLMVRAPISGQLTSINAEIGRSIKINENIAQIDVLDSFKVQANVDQYYLTRVATGQQGQFQVDGKGYTIEVDKVYPEIVENEFKVDFKFTKDSPPSLRQGQSLQVDLSLGSVEDALMVERGGFYRDTGGAWAYVLSQDRQSAARQKVRFGRQNPFFHEVLDGLSEGDVVITSSYQSFSGAERLSFGHAVPVAGR